MTNAKVGMLAGLIDRSGSMAGVKSKTLEGIHALLQEQAKLVKHGVMDKIYCYLAQFDYSPYISQYNRVVSTRLSSTDLDNGYEVLVDMDALDWHNLPDLHKYEPRGMTALYDSLAYLIDEVGKKLSAIPEDQRPGTVVVFINTDGQENDSQKYTAEKVKEMIKHQEDVYSWKFIFMSSDLNAVKEAKSIGISTSDWYESSKTVEAYGVSSKTISRAYRGS